MSFSHMKSVNRRLFLKTSTAGAVGAIVTPTLRAGNGPEPGENSGEIITRKLGNTGIELPVVSMGAAHCTSDSVVKGALKLGINHFDTAHVYLEGNNERFLGKVLKEVPRDSFTIATKVKSCDTKEEYMKLFNESMERLQMDYVDILFLHGVSSYDQAFNEIMVNTLKSIKAEGRAKHIGMSTHRSEPEVIRAAIDNDLYEVVLLAINFKQEQYPESIEMIAKASEAGIGIIGMKVLAGGYLDKEKTKPVNKKAAAKFILKDPNIHTIIPSLNNLEDLQEFEPLLRDLTLTDQEKSDLELASLEQGLYCNACAQCVGTCRKNLNIPDLMRAYMYTYGYGKPARAKELVSRINHGTNPCGECNDCTVQCIKNFDVTERISDVSRLIDMPDEFLA